MIVEKDLVFRPLIHAPWVGNAVVPVNAHFRLSVSKNIHKGMWYVGDDDNYEVAIIAFETEDQPGGSLVYFNGDTVTRGCSIECIRRLAEEASRMTYVGRIEVFDVADRSIHPDLKMRWLTRFHCAKGVDLQDKLKYSNSVWGPKRHRFIQYIP